MMRQFSPAMRAAVDAYEAAPGVALSVEDVERDVQKAVRLALTEGNEGAARLAAMAAATLARREGIHPVERQMAECAANLAENAAICLAP